MYCTKRRRRISTSEGRDETIKRQEGGGRIDLEQRRTQIRMAGRKAGRSKRKKRRMSWNSNEVRKGYVEGNEYESTYPKMKKRGRRCGRSGSERMERRINRTGREQDRE